MTNKVKKFMVIALSVVVLLLTMVLPASAAEIQPRCGNCGQGVLVARKVTTTNRC